MKKCKNGCCTFGSNWKDEDIYCASRPPEGYEKTPEQQKMIDEFMVMYPYYNKILGIIYIENGKPYYKKDICRTAKKDKLAGSISKKGYRRLKCTVDGLPKSIMMHKIAWFNHYGVLPIDQIDHKDHDKDNNNIDNLRLATNGQNQLNTPKRKGLSSIFKGVYKHTKEGLFRAHLQKDKKRYYLGSYSDEASAARAYDQAIIDLELCEFAILNFPENKGKYLLEMGDRIYKYKDLTVVVEKQLNLKAEER